MPSPFAELSAQAPRVYVDQNPKDGVETLTVILDPCPLSERPFEKFIIQAGRPVKIDEEVHDFNKDDFSTIGKPIKDTMTHFILGREEKVWLERWEGIRQKLVEASVPQDGNLRDTWDELLERMRKDRQLADPDAFKRPWVPGERT
ncbi:hypothetical protein ISF_04992 [Cordyceps fumosorosea ARSEF 2679]|uniref:Uncharacterized protein n=1 Tax=Cordyceps fumosorosea (strain ARSEF 2679) TaxID=1081104 RepID=A0A167VYB1_CORFA|nr:hypothetical protein ISF_04992 [Cordyceps fumosorosea ARSEF 2679]OAA63116.1 hypothetical protein ISF_04992 [Cordyceps fumosorosea ARSEF 2679]